MDETLLSHVREVREREKRKESVILRGFGQVDPGKLKDKVREICSFLNVQEVELVDIFRINQDLYRANIVNRQARLNVLSQAKRLRNSDMYKRHYIQRDLTYKQRCEVIAKRSEERVEGTGANLVQIGSRDGVAGGRVAGVVGGSGGGERVGSAIGRNTYAQQVRRMLPLN